MPALTSRRHYRAIAVVLGALAVCNGASAADWPTYAHDPARSGWAKDEHILNPENVPNLRLLWKTHVDNHYLNLTAVTAPVVALRKQENGEVRSIVYVAGVQGAVFAIDGQTGSVVWTKTLRSMTLPGKGGFQGTFLCPSGLTATPVIDSANGNLYVIAPDGFLYGLDLDSGSVRFGPMPFVAPYAKSWSLNLVNNTVYTTVSLGCGSGRAGIYSANITDPQHPVVRDLYLSKQYSAGIWGRGGAVIGENGLIYGGTADGDTNPQHGDYSNTVVAADTRDMSVRDYFLPKNYPYLQKKDFDVGSASPVWFNWKNRHLLAHGFKESVVYLFDADHMGGSDHQTPLSLTPRLGNDQEECCSSFGIWGGMSTSRDEAGNTWLYVPLGGPPSSHAPQFPITNGDNPHGSIMAFRVVADPQTGNPVLSPAWVSGDFRYPDPAVIANGVVFALSNGDNPDQRLPEARRINEARPAILKALDARTGRELYNSGSAFTSWVHFSALAISDGNIYAVDHDSNVYCFGLDKGHIRSATVARKVAQDQLSTSWIGRAERKDEFFKSWMLRILGTAALACLTALTGMVLGLRR